MRFFPLLLLLVCAGVLFTGLDRIGLVDQREARDAEVGRELIEAEEPLTPLYGGEPRYEKPILAYAPEAAVRFLSGAPDLDSRLLRAVAALLLLVLTASVGAEHFGARAGWWAALAAATTLVLPLASRTDGTQLYASVLGWVGASGLADAVFGRRSGRDLRLVVSYAALGAALVCAGPLPALWPLGGLALYLALAKDRDGLRRARPLAGLTLMTGLAIPWYGAMIERHGAAFLARVPFFPYATETRGPWFSGPVLMLSFLVVGFFPWSSVLPGAFLDAAMWWRAARGAISRTERGAAGPLDPDARERHEEGAAHFFIACLLAALVPIAVYPGPPLPAVLPALPAAALLCGRFLDHWFEDPARLLAAFRRAALTLALLGTVGSVLLAMVAPQLRDAAPALRLLAVVVLLTSWAPLLAQLLGRLRLAAGLMLLPAALGTPVTTLRLLPAMEDYLNVRHVVAAMNAVAPPLAPLLVVEPPPPSLRLYGRRNLVQARPLAPALSRFQARDRYAYVAFRPSREREVAREAGTPIEILIRTPSMVLARVRPD